ncbi:alpha/beta fold hydrolase [Phaeobacter inhibens]|uniref:alpha/beta fold hydrolase n=1 Tax=Phaeobacter inhibens TaxID=221822 RepID=UPI0021A38780|nr:alpha/beta hydrolase [Phaeobacter inhibens]
MISINPPPSTWLRLGVKGVVTAGLVLALGVGVTLWRATTREAEAVSAYPPQGTFVIVEGQQVHLLDLGQPAARPAGARAPDLVLIHGASGHIRDMTFRLAPTLSDRYRVIIVDRPGLGYSDRTRGAQASLSRQAALIRGAVAELGAKRPIVLGQSYGGGVALAWALDAPESLSALVTVGAVSHPWPTPLSTFYKITSSPLGQRLAVPVLTAYVPETTIRDTLTEVFAPQPVPAGYFEHFGPGLTLRRSALRANARQRADLLAEIKMMAPRYGALRLPIEAVHGSADTTVGLDLHARQLERDVPTLNLTVLEGIGHMPHQVATDAVAAAVDRAAARAATAENLR